MGIFSFKKRTEEAEQRAREAREKEEKAAAAAKEAREREERLAEEARQAREREAKAAEEAKERKEKEAAAAARERTNKIAEQLDTIDFRALSGKISEQKRKELETNIKILEDSLKNADAVFIDTTKIDEITGQLIRKLKNAILSGDEKEAEDLISAIAYGVGEARREFAFTTKEELDKELEKRLNSLKALEGICESKKSIRSLQEMLEKAEEGYEEACDEFETKQQERNDFASKHPRVVIEMENINPNRKMTGELLTFSNLGREMNNAYQRASSLGLLISNYKEQQTSLWISIREFKECLNRASQAQISPKAVNQLTELQEWYKEQLDDEQQIAIDIAKITESFDTYITNMFASVERIQQIIEIHNEAERIEKEMEEKRKNDILGAQILKQREREKAEREAKLQQEVEALNQEQDNEDRILNS